MQIQHPLPLRRFRYVLTPPLLLTLAISSAPGQKAPPAISPAAKQTFEVASVRLEDPNSTVDYNDPRANTQTTVFPSNRLMLRHTTLKGLICRSYAVDCGNVLKLPDSLLQQHYDLDAKIEGDTLLTSEQMRPLLQNLLEERLNLKAHHEQKIVLGYALVVTKGGSKLQPNKGAPFGGFLGGPYLKSQNVSLPQFAKTLETVVKQPIIDRTGIAGMYDFDLQYGPHGPANDDPRFSELPESAYANLPDIFVVLEEKLGLKLVPEKITIETLVIDHVDKVPKEN